MTEEILKNDSSEKVKLLTVREAYERLRISKWKLYDLIRANKIKTIKIGRRRLVLQQSIEEYILELWKASLD